MPVFPPLNVLRCGQEAKLQGTRKVSCIIACELGFNVASSAFVNFPHRTKGFSLAWNSLYTYLVELPKERPGLRRVCCSASLLASPKQTLYWWEISAEGHRSTSYWLPWGLRICMPVQGTLGHGISSWSRKILHATEQQSRWATATEAQVPRVCAQQQEKPPQWETHALQLGKAHTPQWRASTAKNK